MKIQSIRYLGFEGIPSDPIELDPRATLVIGPPGRGKSRLLALFDATVGELRGRQMPRAFLRGDRGKVTIAWTPDPGERALVGEPAPLVSEIFAGDQPLREASSRVDIAASLVRKRGFDARACDASDGKLDEAFANALVDHELGLVTSDDVERFKEALAGETPVRVGKPRREGRGFVPGFATPEGERSFSALPRTFRSAVGLFAAVMAGHGLVLVDDAHLASEAMLAAVLNAAHPATQVVMTSARPLDVPARSYSLG
ncbi:MAG: hypothetical protein JNK04_21945 [Myxococcales bacterium]|nr:hypothetical protein [Myxococcales bacterium]